MRAYSGRWLMVAGLSAMIALNSRLPSTKAKGEAPADGAAAAADDGAPKKKSKPVAGKDRVDSAFALPNGVELNVAQQTAYDDLKQKYEATLRQAYDDVDQADDAAARGVALKKVRETRDKIRAGIREIVATPRHEAAGQPAAGNAAGGNAVGGPVPGGNVPPYGGYYPNGYYPNGYYPNGYYPNGAYSGGYSPYGYYPPYGYYSNSHGTKNVAANVKPVPPPGTKFPPKQAPKPAPKPAPAGKH